jgi:hypothetical protein
VNIIPKFTSEFHKYNFILLEPCLNSENIVYHGILPTEKYGNIEIDFLFEDNAFVDFPHALIGISSQGKFKPFHFPHIDASWTLCYHDHSKIFDRYNPKGMVQFCIENATNVLNGMIENDMSEIIKEFPSYWHTNTKKYYSFLSPDDTVACIQENWILSPNIQFKMTNESGNKACIFKMPNTPSIANIEWPIEKYSDFQAWINKTSPETEKEIQRYLKTMIGQKYYKICFIIFLVDINIYLGAYIEYKSSVYNMKGKAKLRPETIESVFKGNHIFHRFTIENYTDKSLIESNVSVDSFTFLNKKILLIGAGTIGSNLSNLLVKNGAGIGADALFTIVDDDKYEPYNFSRHFLGIKYSGYNKASSLKIELEYAFPFAKVNAVDISVQDIGFNNYDIIIDSTGEESLTQWLNEKIITDNLCALFISAWVHGQGVTAECFAFPNRKGACHECFRKSEYYGYLDLTDLPIRNSCNSIYIPFPITASIYTALLIINVLYKWLEGGLTESTFFTQKLNPVGGINKVIITKSEWCSLCGKD